MSNLFATPAATEMTEGKRSIPGATILKSYAVQLASEIMAKIPTADDAFLETIKDSQASTAAMDDLVKTECGGKLVNEEVATFGEEEVHKLLKSHQSNRSRRKKLAMTQSNYVELLTAAIAEWVLRESCNIKKSAGGFATGRKSIVINEETVAQLAEDQEELGKAIRNIQSKKSTYKAKHMDNPDYTQDAEWLELLEQEAMLKAVRTTQPAARKGLSLKKALQFIFDGVGNTAELSKDESYAIIDACRELSKGVYPQDYVDMVAAQQAAKAMAAEATAEDDGVYAE